MISADDARRAVLAAVGRQWRPTQGQLVIDENTVYENDDVFTMSYGAREFIEEMNFAYGRAGDPVAVVSKVDGAVSFHPGGPPPVSDLATRFPDRVRVDPR